MSRSEAYIVRATLHGRRLEPITTKEADALVEKKLATCLKTGSPGFYDGTKQGNQPRTMTRKLETKPTAPTSRSKKEPSKTVETDPSGWVIDDTKKD